MMTYKLGPLPWSKDTLDSAYWRKFSEAYEAIREHPGYDLHERTQSLSATLKLFCKWGERFLDDLARFHIEVHERRILDRSRARDFESFEEKFRESLYIFSSSAMSLVEQCRGLTKHVKLPGYEVKKDALFAQDTEHRFVQEIRNDLIHLTFHQPNWQLSTGRDGQRETEMILFPHQFRRADEWNVLARQYLQERPNGIFVGRLIREYMAKVVVFHEWLHLTIMEVEGDEIADYLRCERHLNGIGAQCGWRLLLTQIIIPNKKDPFHYLDRYLTPEQLSEIGRLPQRSKQQVDQIIEMVDEYGACNTELRELAYQAFAISESK